MTTSAQTSNTAPTAQQLVYAVANVYNQFSFKLSSDGSKYKLWCRIFKDICMGAKVLGHINGKSKPTGDDDEDWYSIDSRVKSWFYSTCDPSVLQVITTDSCTAKNMWDNLHEYFLNNKMPRMLQLQEQFRNTKKGASTVHEYCHTLKQLADALHDVESEISELELVMQILRGLPPSFQSIVDVITNTKPFPSFMEAKNMLLLHEHRDDHNDTNHDPTQTTTTALYSSSNQSGKSKNKWNKNRSNNRVTSKGGGPSSISTNANNFAGTSSSPTTQFAGIIGATPNANASLAPQQFVTPTGYYFSNAPHGVNNFGGPPQAPTPLSPFSAGPAHPLGPNQQAQAFPHPFFQAQQQFQPHAAHFGQSTAHLPRPSTGPMLSQPNGNFFPPPGAPQQPTDLASVFQAMSLQQPPDNQYYMDTGATSHMNFNQGS